MIDVNRMGIFHYLPFTNTQPDQTPVLVFSCCECVLLITASMSG